MKAIPFLLIAAGLVLSGLVSCAPAGHSHPPSTPDDPRAAAETARLEHELNRYRRSIGKPPVARHAGLDEMARYHCEFMARNPGKFTLGSAMITHLGFEERVLRAQRQHGMLSIAENVAGGTYSSAMPERFVKAWAASNGHDFNLRQDWDATGLGVFITPEGRAYATQIFATRSRSHFELTDRMRHF